MRCECTPCEAIAPTTDPKTPDKAVKFSNEKPPCYFPQPEDILVEPPKEGNMGPIGPWATGRLDWSPLAGLTGTRPIVDKCSITRYSEGEWRRRNFEMLEKSTRQQHSTNLVNYNARQCLDKALSGIDKNQEENTEKLRNRQSEIYKWKMELEQEIEAMADEIKSVEEQRTRMQHASEVLLLPESIAGECLERRTSRLDTELVRDEVEEELIKELALTGEIKETFQRALRDVEFQLGELKVAKQRMEFDWSDKKYTLEIETFNVGLNNKSRNLMFKPGSVTFPEEQSNMDYYDHFTRGSLEEARNTRLKTSSLRANLDSILDNAARDLRTQAEKVQLALSKRVDCTQETAVFLENELMKILQKLADIEILKEDLMTAIRRLDTPMKKAQTRLEHRLLRPRVENCRDEPHYGLIDEVKTINERVSALQSELQEADRTQQDLIQTRNDLEREIIVKRKSLEIDLIRTQAIRSFYPSVTRLSGHS